MCAGGHGGVTQFITFIRSEQVQYVDLSSRFSSFSIADNLVIPDMIPDRKGPGPLHPASVPVASTP